MEKILEMIQEDQVLEKLSDFFSVFGDPSRMKIISLLRLKSLNVGELAELMDMSSSAISHQLRLLKQHDLVRSKRQGKYIYYRLSDDHVKTIFDMGLDHLLES